MTFKHTDLCLIIPVYGSLFYLPCLHISVSSSKYSDLCHSTLSTDLCHSTLSTDICLIIPVYRPQTYHPSQLIFISLSKSLISPLTNAVISLTGLFLDLTKTSIYNLLLQTHSNQTIIALSPTSMIQSQSLLPYTRLIGTWLTLTIHHLMLNFPVLQSFHLFKRQASFVNFCALY